MELGSDRIADHYGLEGEPKPLLFKLALKVSGSYLEGFTTLTGQLTENVRYESWSQNVFCATAEMSDSYRRTRGGKGNEIFSGKLGIFSW